MLVTDSKPPESNNAPDPLDDFIGGKLDIPGNDDRKERVRQIILGACHRDPLKRSTVKALQEAVSRLLQRTTIVLNIVGIDYDALDEDQLVRELAARLGLCILSTRKKRGSVLVELELTPAQAEHLLTEAKAGKLADLGVSGAWKLQSQMRSEIHAAQETDVELGSIPIRERGRWVRWLLPVAASAAALLITIWFTISFSATDPELASAKAKLMEMDRELASAKTTSAKLEKELRDADRKLAIAQKTSSPDRLFVDGNLSAIRYDPSKERRVLHVRLSTRTYAELALNLGPDVKITIDGQYAGPEDLQVGMIIRLGFNKNLDTLMSIEAKTKP